MAGQPMNGGSSGGTYSTGNYFGGGQAYGSGYFSKGGEVRKNYNEGGKVSGPGTPTSDSVPAYLSNHEFVVNADSTNRYRPVLNEINKGSDEHDVLKALLPLVVNNKESNEKSQRALAHAIAATHSLRK